MFLGEGFSSRNKKRNKMQGSFGRAGGVLFAVERTVYSFISDNITTRSMLNTIALQSN